MDIEYDSSFHVSFRWSIQSGGPEWAGYKKWCTHTCLSNANQTSQSPFLCRSSGGYDQDVAYNWRRVHVFQSLFTPKPSPNFSHPKFSNFASKESKWSQEAISPDHRAAYINQPKSIHHPREFASSPCSTLGSFPKSSALIPQPLPLRLQERQSLSRR